MGIAHEIDRRVDRMEAEPLAQSCYECFTINRGMSDFLEQEDIDRTLVRPGRQSVSNLRLSRDVQAGHGDAVRRRQRVVVACQGRAARDRSRHTRIGCLNLRGAHK